MAEPDPMTTPLLRMRGIKKAYPGVQALRGVDLTLHAGEVLALLGENGAGKSTLMKILGGAVQPDSGQILLDGTPIAIHTPHDAARHGIAMVHQEFNLIPALSARENIFLGREQTRAGWIPKRDESVRAAEVLRRLGVDLEIELPCRRLSVAQQQAVEIAKALCLQARLLVLDEPSAALTTREVERLFAILRQLKAQGLGLIYISHRLDEIFEIADRVMILRDGESVSDTPARGLNRAQLIEKMVGRELKEEFPKRKAAVGPARLVVRELRRARSVRGVSFEVRRGEILALAGLAGSGRTSVARLVFGADRREAGEIHLDGRALELRHPRQAIRSGIGLLTEDRKSQGLVLPHSLRDNFGLPNLDRYSRWGIRRRGREHAAYQHHAAAVAIKSAGPDQAARELSGGNQQKLVLAKWLARNCEVLIFDEPTRGIDVGAKYEIYLLMNDLAAQGKSILMISSELPEVLGMADRILVMHDGRITGEISDPARATQQDIMELAVA